MDKVKAIFSAFLHPAFWISVIAFMVVIALAQFIEDQTIYYLSASIVYLLFVVFYGALAARTSHKANQYNGSAALIKDLHGDVGVVIVGVVFLMFWLAVIPTHVSGLDYGSLVYWMQAIFLMLILFISIWELTQTYTAGARRMESLNETAVRGT